LAEDIKLGLSGIYSGFNIIQYFY